MFFLLGKNYYTSSLSTITYLHNHNRFTLTPSTTHDSSPFPPPASLSTFQLTSETQVYHLLRYLPSKQCDIDPIPTSLMKDCASTLVPIIQKIINLSFCNGSFPLLFKHSLYSHTTPQETIA